MLRPWHIIVLISIFYISWRAILAIPPRFKLHRREKYHYANFGLSAALGQLLFLFILFNASIEISPVLLFACFVTWSGTVIVTLVYAKTSVFVRRTSLVLVIAAPFLFFAYPGGGSKLLDDIDSFAEQVLHAGPETSSEVDSGANPTTSSASNSDRKESTPEGTSEKSDENAFRVSHLVKAIFFFVQAYFLTSYYGRMWRYRYEANLRTKGDRSIGKEAVEQVISVFSIAISIWVSFVLLGFDTLSVSVFSGLVVLGVSVALKDLLSNFVAGILLLWDKSIKLKDVIAIDESRGGQVMDITMRYMIIQDRSDIQYLVPHSQMIDSVVENWTRENRIVRLKLDIGVAYNSPIEKVKDIMRSVCFEVPRVLKEPLPTPLIMSMDDSAIHFQLRFRIADPEKGIRNVMSDVYERLLVRFKEHEIVIPYPQRDIHLLAADEDSTVATHPFLI